MGREDLFQIAGDYFFTCKLMHDEAHKRRSSLTAKKPRPMSIQKFMRYNEMYLGTLFVACEGFSELNLMDAKTQELYDQHKDSLRLMRNGTFHFQKTSAKKAQFFDGTAVKMNWAEDLYDALENIIQTHIVNFHVEDGLELYHLDGRKATGEEIQALLRRIDSNDETLTAEDRLYDKSELGK